MYFLTQTKNNISSLERKRLIGVSYRTAWLVKHKLMQIMFEQEQTTKLSGRVEADDAYFGGELEGGKGGRVSENKVPFIAAVQTNNERHPIYAVFSSVKGFSQEAVKQWASQRLVPGEVVAVFETG